MLQFMLCTVFGIDRISGVTIFAVLQGCFLKLFHNFSVSGREVKLMNYGNKFGLMNKRDISKL